MLACYGSYCHRISPAPLLPSYGVLFIQHAIEIHLAPLPRLTLSQPLLTHTSKCKHMQGGRHLGYQTYTF